MSNSNQINNNKQCPICMEYHMGTHTECGHYFCINCLTKWVCSKPLHQRKCPLCRGPISIAKFYSKLPHRTRSAVHNIKKSSFENVFDSLVNIHYIYKIMYECYGQVITNHLYTNFKIYEFNRSMYGWMDAGILGFGVRTIILRNIGNQLINGDMSLEIYLTTIFKYLLKNRWYITKYKKSSNAHNTKNKINSIYRFFNVYFKFNKSKDLAYQLRNL